MLAIVSHADVIEGKVLDSKNRPIVNADVLVRSQSDFGEPLRFDHQKTNTNGVFRIDLKFWGQPIAIAWAAAPGKAPFGISLSNKANVIRLDDAQIIRGRVVDQNNNPVKGVNIRFVGLRGGKDRSRFVDMRGTPWKDRFSTVTDAQGKWQLQCAPVGDIAHLQMHDARFVTVDLSVKEGRDSIRTQVRPGAVLTGRIVDSKGYPVPNVTVRTYGGSASDFGNEISQVDAKGRYRLSGLPAGTYSISPSKDSLVAPKLNSIFAVEGKTTSVPDIAMTPGGLISGHVLNTDTGKPVRGAEIHIRDINKEHQFETVCITNHDGQYHQRVVPGRYQVSITSGGEGYLEWEITSEITVKEKEIILQHFIALPGAKLNPIENVDSPQEMIKAFIKELKQSPCNCDTFHYYSADHVMGANCKDQALASIAKQAAEELSQVNIEATDFEIVPDMHHADRASVGFTMIFSNDAQGYELKQKNIIDIQLITDAKGQQWKIIPQSPDFYLADFYSNNLPPAKSTFITYWASLVAHPREMQNGFYLYKSEMQLEKLGKALFMCVQDYDEKFPFTPEEFRERVLPYADDESLFTAPGDAAGFTSYSINANIKGLNLEGMGMQSHFGSNIIFNTSSPDIPSPHTLVAIYLGHDQKLDFKYGGYSVVCFMDGHVEKVTREQAKKLRWK
jgi:protocatechuate 3,4-dioxygenase beta subunit